MRTRTSPVRGPSSVTSSTAGASPNACQTAARDMADSYHVPVMAAIQLLADRLARLGSGRRTTLASLQLSEPEHAWKLVIEPTLWELWMPAVSGLLDRDRPIRFRERYRVSLRLQGRRLGFGGATAGVVEVLRYEPERELAWQLIAGGRTEVFVLRRDGAAFTLDARGGV